MDVPQWRQLGDTGYCDLEGIEAHVGVRVVEADVSQRHHYTAGQSQRRLSISYSYLVMHMSLRSKTGHGDRTASAFGLSAMHNEKTLCIKITNSTKDILVLFTCHRRFTATSEIQMERKRSHRSIFT